MQRNVGALVRFKWTVEVEPHRPHHCWYHIRSESLQPVNNSEVGFGVKHWISGKTDALDERMPDSEASPRVSMIDGLPEME